MNWLNFYESARMTKYYNRADMKYIQSTWRAEHVKKNISEFFDHNHWSENPVKNVKIRVSFPPECERMNMTFFKLTKV